MDECFERETGDGQNILIASNRGPVTFQEDENGELTYKQGSGGLVTALAGLTRHVEASWVSCAMTEGDRLWQRGEIAFRKDGSPIQVQFLTPTQEEYERYYNIIANPLLWFLQHSMWDVPRAPVIDKSTWEAWVNGYVPVNRLFGSHIAYRVRTSQQRSLVMLQDYHLYLAARTIRTTLRPKERPPILHFTHIPWPGPEYWGILPSTMRHQILEGMTGADILGFQTREDALNFIRTCESYLQRASTNYKRGRIWYQNHATYVRDFPISINVENLRVEAESPEVLNYQKDIEEIIRDRKLILRIDRIEPSKNIIRGFQAYEEMLEDYPQHHRRVNFLALLVPSRMDVLEYQAYLNELMGVAGRINAQFGDHEWEPVRIIVGENYPRAVAALKMYDVLLVNSIADGMNLVAKEGAAINQKNGALILSERAGARQQLQFGATIISPCDIYSTAEALHHSLEMSESEKEERAQRLRWVVEKEDINAWLCDQLNAVEELGLY